MTHTPRTADLAFPITVRTRETGAVKMLTMPPQPPAASDYYGERRGTSQPRMNGRGDATGPQFLGYGYGESTQFVDSSSLPAPADAGVIGEHGSGYSLAAGGASGDNTQDPDDTDELMGWARNSANGRAKAQSGGKGTEGATGADGGSFAKRSERARYVDTFNATSS
eukprot:Opistho-2@63862